MQQERHLYGAILVAVLVVTGPACRQDRPDPPTSDVVRPRNLIMISIDTLRADHLSSYGYDRKTSPRLDHFASRGIVFKNTISSSGWTVPAHMSVFTGLEPPAHGLIDFPETGRLAEEHRTLAGLLRDAGLRTAAFTGGGFLSDRFGFDIGFETYQASGRRFHTKVAPVNAWLDSLEDEEPFFLFLHGFDVHRPYRPPEPFASSFLGNSASTRSGETVADRLYPLLEDLAVLARETGEGPITARPTEEQLTQIISQYDGEIGFVDSLLGSFLELLDSRGLLETTLVVVISDHGDEFYEHGGLDHVHTLYDELLKVAWFMFGPGVPPGRVERQVGLIDVLPTVLDTMGIEVPGSVQGVSRRPLFTGRGSNDALPDDELGDAVYSFTGFSNYPYRLASVRTSRWKLVRWSLSGMQAIDLESMESREHYTHLFREQSGDFSELFDLAADPAERRDVSDLHPDLTQRLVNGLDARIAASRELAHVPGEPRPIRSEELEALKSLGYVQ